MNALSARERKLVAVLILVALVVLAIYGIIAPLLGGFDDRAEARAALLATWSRDDRTIGQLGATRRLAETQRRSASRFRLAATTPAAASDLLRERLSGAVTALGGELRAVEDQPPAPGLARARLDARLTLAELTTLLARLQNEPPLLVVEGLTVTADSIADPARAGRLDVRLEIAARSPATPAR